MSRIGVLLPCCSAGYTECISAPKIPLTTLDYSYFDSVSGVIFRRRVPVPFMKYSATPPTVGRTDTIGTRTGWYLAAMLILVGLAAAVVFVLLPNY
ncbi:CbtA family protein [Mycobacterium lepromatosis]|uniref:CbtA family protein n=1 Tax=Mycobacterium lepromatosis TaxID=480418 RepID=UPI000A607CCA